MALIHRVIVPDEDYPKGYAILVTDRRSIFIHRRDQNSESSIRFYAVPLGVYFKPRRHGQTRETILRDYATNILENYRTVLPSNIVSTHVQTSSMVD